MYVLMFLIKSFYLCIYLKTTPRLPVLRSSLDVASLPVPWQELLVAARHSITPWPGVHQVSAAIAHLLGAHPSWRAGDGWRGQPCTREALAAPPAPGIPGDIRKLGPSRDAEPTASRHFFAV